MRQHPRTGSSATRTFRKAMIEVGRSEQMIIEMDKLANEDHTYKASKEEIEFYRGQIGGSTRMWHTFDSVPTRYEPEFKKCVVQQCNA